MQETPQETNKTVVYSIVGIIVLGLIGWAIYSFNNKGNNEVVTTDNQTVQDKIPVDATSTPPTGSQTRLSYGDAIKAYPYRFQFSNCSGNPGTLAVKKGSVVMLDNRDAVSHTIKADKQTFKIAAYDYALLHTSALSNTNITCDGGGAAVLNVQK